MTGSKDVRCEFDIAVIDGKLANGGGVTIPIDLVAALHAEAKSHQVTDLQPNTSAEEDQQSQLFADELMAIWNAVGGATNGWQLSATFEPTSGSRPPWKRGTGAMYGLLSVDTTTGAASPTYAFTNGTAQPAESVTVKFLLSLQFV
ncbi:MAG: hypothetical protein KAI24_11725 [Planctomycetes bacterium]|nr:hypothetical protein [Planctomycetota bacterium]